MECYLVLQCTSLWQSKLLNVISRKKKTLIGLTHH